MPSFVALRCFGRPKRTIEGRIYPLWFLGVPLRHVYLTPPGLSSTHWHQLGWMLPIGQSFSRLSDAHLEQTDDTMLSERAIQSNHTSNSTEKARAKGNQTAHSPNQEET